MEQHDLLAKQMRAGFSRDIHVTDTNQFLWPWPNKPPGGKGNMSKAVNMKSAARAGSKPAEKQGARRSGPRAGKGAKKAWNPWL